MQANNRLAKRGGHTMAITPRHYLDFINQYANLFNEKRSELEEQQMHLNVGLRKIKETVDQVQYLMWRFHDDMGLDGFVPLYRYLFHILNQDFIPLAQ